MSRATGRKPDDTMAIGMPAESLQTNSLRSPAIEGNHSQLR